MFDRDPGSAPQTNDRIPYVFVESTKKDALMGDRIEHVDHVKRLGLRVDTKTYIENQVRSFSLAPPGQAKASAKMATRCCAACRATDGGNYCIVRRSRSRASNFSPSPWSSCQVTGAPPIRGPLRNHHVTIT
jgi:hypothetical protein